MTSNHNNNMANAMSGKTARACDCCVRRRARWYCAADDAFLCQSCDSSVHSANPLARRHERVRLKTASLKQSDNLPTWHRGLTRKPRTPRHGKNSSSSNKSSNTHNNNNMMGQQNPLHMVPDLGVEETTSFSSSHGEDEEQLLFRVPIYDPFVSELCTSTTNTPTLDVKNDHHHHHHHHQFMMKSPADGYLPSDLDLEEFAADVETLLGKGLDDESYGIEELGLLDYSPTSNNNHNNHISINDDDDDEKVVKEENVLLLGDHINNSNNNVELIKKCELDIIESDDVGFRVPFELSFDYDTDFPTTCEEQDNGYDHHNHHHGLMMVDDSSVVVDEIINDDSNRGLCKVEEEDDDDKESNEVLINKRRKILLRLDYDAISTAWANQGSPWINGQRPQINQDDCWPHCMGACGTGVHHTLFGDVPTGGTGGHCRVGDGGREARVSRYREKRRTRLFSKKIRYEVRKLNAEKRPRMKGRFVKRSSFAPTTTSFPLVSKK